MLIGIDAGGTGIKYGLVRSTGEVVHFNKRPTEAQFGPDHVIERIAECIEILSNHAQTMNQPILAIGIGFAGPLDLVNGVVIEAPNLPGWTRIPLRDRLQERFRLPVVLENDANAAVYGEWWCGVGKGYKNMVGLTLGTGIGGGLIIDGRLYRGQIGAAGEIGHMVIDPNGPKCACGNQGCLEAFASGSAITRRAREAIDAGQSSQLITLANGDLSKLTAKMVHDAQKTGDALATRLMLETARYLGIAIASLINVFNPDIVSLSGGVANAGEDLFAPLRAEAGARAFKQSFEGAQILQARLTDNAGVVGAAGVALDQLGALKIR